MTEEHKRKIGESNKIALRKFFDNGGKAWHSGLRIEKTCPICGTKYSIKPCHKETNKFCSKKCAYKGRKTIKGKEHWNWNGGKSKKYRNERKEFMLRAPYKKWRKSVFERDDYTCQICRKRSSKNNHVYIVADHIKPYALFKELRLDVSNGRTLCRGCHYKHGAVLNQHTIKTYVLTED